MSSDHLAPTRTPTPPERRRFPRIAIKGTALLHFHEDVVRGRIENISASGILVALWSPLPQDLANDLDISDIADVEVRLDAARSQWIPVHGTICRLAPREIAVCFEGAPPALFIAMMDEMLPASGRHRQATNVILIDESPPRRAALARAFREAGCVVIETSSPLEFLVRLGEQSFEPHVIAIADSIPPSTSQQLRSFIERYHPDAQLLTIGVDADTGVPHTHVHRLSSADPAHDLRTRFDTLLARHSEKH